MKVVFLLFVIVACVAGNSLKFHWKERIDFLSERKAQKSNNENEVDIITEFKETLEIDDDSDYYSVGKMDAVKPVATWPDNEEKQAEIIKPMYTWPDEVEIVRDLSMKWPEYFQDQESRSTRKLPNK